MDAQSVACLAPGYTNPSTHTHSLQLQRLGMHDCFFKSVKQPCKMVTPRPLSTASAASALGIGPSFFSSLSNCSRLNWNVADAVITNVNNTKDSNEEKTVDRKKGATRIPRSLMEREAMDVQCIQNTASAFGLDPELVELCRIERFANQSYSEEMGWLWQKLIGSVEFDATWGRFVRYKLENGQVVTKVQVWFSNMSITVSVSLLTYYCLILFLFLAHSHAHPLVKKTFMAVYMLARTRIQELEKRALDPRVHQPKTPAAAGSPQGLRNSPVEIAMAAWMESYIDYYADEQPNGKNNPNSQSPNSSW